MKSSSYDVENDIRLYVWIEPLATVQIQVEKFYTTPSKNSAYNIYKKTNQFVRKPTYLPTYLPTVSMSFLYVIKRSTRMFTLTSLQLLLILNR